MTENLPLPSRQLDERSLGIVESFESAWESGRPSITEHFDRHPDRPLRLLLELAAIDLENRRSRGEQVGAEEYCGRFPSLAADPECVAELHLVGSPQRAAPATSPRSADDPLVGSIVGGVTIVRLIGEGGMGRVYEGRQDKPRRPVAVKVIRPEFTSPKMLKRFEYEAQVLGHLRHPGIAQIFTVGTHDLAGKAVPYFVMEYIPNAKPLTQYAEERRLSTHERLELFRKVCEAVAHGHQKGVIHRDLKPGNVLVDSSGQPKVIDFGVARSTDGDRMLTTMQTDVGALVGTLQYMSPEQFDADPHDLDVRLDVYAMGVILYELLTGKPPYDLKRRAIHEAARVVREEEPTPISTLNKTLRRDVAIIAGKCLQKDRDRRYSSATELAGDVSRYLAGEPITASPPSFLDAVARLARRHRVAASAVAAVAITLVAAVVGISLFAARSELARSDAEVARREARTKADDFRKLLSRQYDIKGNEALQADDRALALLWFTKALEIDEGDPTREPLHRRRIAQTRQRMPHLVSLAEHAARINCVDMSPDGRSLATGSCDGTAKIWDCHTGRQIGQTMHHGGNVYQAVFSPDGRFVATACGDGTARLWDAKAGLPLSEPLVHAFVVSDVRFSPDGKRLASSCSGLYSGFYSPRSGVDISKDRRHEHALENAPRGAIWEVPSCRRVANVSLPGGTIAWSPEGDVVACAGAPVQFIDAATGAESRPRLQSFDAPTRIHYADVNHLVIRDFEGDCTVWDLRTNRVVIKEQPFDGAFVRGNSLSRILDDKYLVAGRQVWDLQSGRIDRVVGDRSSLGQFTIGDRLYLVQSVTGGIRLYSADDGDAVSPVLGVDVWPPPVCVSADRRFVACVDDNTPNLLQIFDLAGLGSDLGASLPTADDVSPWLRASRGLKPGPTGSLPAPMPSNGRYSEKRLLHGSLQDHAHVLDGVMTADGNVVVTSGGDGRIRFWDSKTGAAIPPHIDVDGVAVDIALVANDTVVIASVQAPNGNEKTTVHGWTMHNRKPCWEPTTGTYRGYTLAVSPTGRYFSRNSGSHEIEVWDAFSGKQVFAAPRQAYFVEVPRFGPQEDFVVFPGGDGRVTVWSVPDGKLLHTWETGDEPTSCCDISHDGRTIAAMANFLHRWDVTSGRRIGKPMKVTSGWPTVMHFSPDDTSILVAESTHPSAFLVDVETGNFLGPRFRTPFDLDAIRASGSSYEKYWRQAWLVMAAFREGVPAISVRPHGGLEQTWRFEVDERDVPNLLTHAVAAAGRDIDASGNLVMVEPERRVELLSEHLRRFPEDGVVTADRVRSWRLQELHRVLDGRNASAVSLEAVAILEQLLAENPGDLGLLSYAWIFAAAGQPDRAARLHARRILAVPVDSSEWRQFEASLAESDIQPEIETLADDTLRENPDSTAAYQLKGLATLQRGDAATALELLAKACDLGATGQVHSYRAAAHALQKAWKEAEAEFLVLLADEPNDLPALRGLMAVRLAVGDAAGWQKAARELHSRPGQGNFQYGPRAAEVTRAFASRPISSGIGFDSKWLVRQVEKFAADKPRDPATRVALATALFRDGQFQRAVETLTGDALRDAGPWEMLILAISQQKLGNTPAAQEAHAQAVRRLAADETAGNARDWRTRCELEQLARETAALVPTPTTAEQPTTP